MKKKVSGLEMQGTFKTSEKAEPKEMTEVRKELKRSVRRFSLIRHPRSEEGENFLEIAQAVLGDSDASIQELERIQGKLPSIETPHLEYFEDVFQEIPKEAMRKIAFDLGVIQTSKGCSKNCSHCAIAAEGRLQTMPYITILKIIEKIENEREEFIDEYQKEGQEIVDEVRGGVVDEEKIRQHFKLQEEVASHAEGVDNNTHRFGVMMRIGDQLDDYCDKKIEKLEERMPEIVGMDWAKMGSDERKRLQEEIFERYFPGKIENRIRQVMGLSKEELEAYVKKTSQSLKRSFMSGSLENFLYLDPPPKLFEEVIMGKGQSLNSLKSDKAFSDLLNPKEVFDLSLETLGKNKKHPFITGKDSVLPPGNSLADILTSFDDVEDETVKRQIRNYYDSDPMDYRDTTIRHEDGSPADYGDVVKVMEDRLGQEVDIITAGWRKSDKVAQRAGERLAEMNHLVTISVHFWGKEARQDPVAYQNSIKNIIKTLGSKNLKIRWFGDKSKEMVLKVCDELGVSLARGQLSEAGVSTFSGRAEGKKFDNVETSKDFDVMRCMPGYHITPDGKISYQKAKESGDRPTDTGMKVF